MYRKITSVLVCTLATLAATGGAAFANPPDTTIEIDYRSDPMDRQSSVVFSVSLHLSPASTTAHSVCWQITSAEFSKPQAGWSWSTGALAVSGTSDGYWCLGHDDPDNPVASEFTQLPSIAGVALSNQSQTKDLEFSLIAGNQSLSPEDMPFGNQTAFSTHTFQVEGDDEPEDDGDDEPVGVNPPTLT